MSQPAVVTTEPSPNSIPAVGPGVTTLELPNFSDNSTRTIVVSADASTTIIISAPETLAPPSGPQIPSTSKSAVGSTSSYPSTFLTSPSISSTATSTSDSANNGGGTGTNIGAIVGGVVGGLAVIGIVVVAMYWIKRRHPKQKASESQIEEHKTIESAGFQAPLAELEQGSVRPAPELDAQWNQINEMPAVKK